MGGTRKQWHHATLLCANQAVYLLELVPLAGSSRARHAC